LAEVKFCKPSFRRSQARLAAASISGPLWVKSSAAVRVYFECAAVLCTVRAELMGERIRDKFAVSRRKGMQRFESCHPSMRANVSRAGGECS
jgi:hypothetical protein